VFFFFFKKNQKKKEKKYTVLGVKRFNLSFPAVTTFPGVETSFAVASPRKKNLVLNISNFFFLKKKKKKKNKKK